MALGYDPLAINRKAQQTRSRTGTHLGSVTGDITQRIDLGMRFTSTLGVTAGDDLSIADDHAAHARIGAGQEQAFGSLVERSAHGIDVVR
jgi:hypothetical protein